MATTPEISFALKAINEASKVLKDIQSDIDNLADTAANSDGKLGGMAEQLSEIAEAAGEGAESVSGYGSALGGLAEGGGNAERALMGVSDITGFLGDQFGVSLGPLNDFSGAFAQLGGGIEAALQGGPALVSQLKALPATLGPVIAATWAHVAALTAQAAAFIAANWPILAIIAGLAAVGAAIYLLVTHWDEVKAGFNAVKDAIIGAANTVVGFFRDNWPEIALFISGPFAPLLILATDAFGIRTALIDAFQAVLNWFPGAWNAVSGLVSGAFTAIVGAAADAFGVKSALTGAFSSALTFIGELAGTAWEAAQKVGGGIKDGVIAGLGAIGDFASSIGNAVIMMIETAVNWVVDQINDALPNDMGWGPFSIDLPDNPLPRLSIPRLATGGIVTEPTIALIGEAGPEAVIPLTAGAFGPPARSFAAQGWAGPGGAQPSASDILAGMGFNEGYYGFGDAAQQVRDQVQWLLYTGAISQEEADAILMSLPGGSTALRSMSGNGPMTGDEYLALLNMPSGVRWDQQGRSGLSVRGAQSGGPGAGVPGRGSGQVVINYYGPDDPHEFRRFLQRAGVFA